MFSRHLVRPTNHSIPRCSRLSSPSYLSTLSNQKKIDFNDVKSAFAKKSNEEIIRSLLVFRLCSIPFLVKNSKKLLDASYSILGSGITNTILRQTFFGHFCAGENEKEITPLVEKLRESGIGAILDYAAEADVEQPREREGIVSARTYDYDGEAQCDANVKTFLSCIDTTSKKPNGFAAIKATALGQPELLQSLSSILLETQKLFREFVERGREGENKEGEGVDMHYEGKINLQQFQNGLKAIGVALNEEQIKNLFDKMDSEKSGYIDYYNWISFLDPRSLGGLNPKFKSKGLPTLSEDELNKLNALISRLDVVCASAYEKKVMLMVDAEQTYMQPAIDHLVLTMQRKYNTSSPVIYNTFQCYLKDSYSRILIDLERAKREGFWFAAKLVRGAYMVQERKLAQEKGYADPIHNDIESTHNNYNKCVNEILNRMKKQDPNCSIMVASHNEKSVQNVIDTMLSLSLPLSSSHVYFGQLLGMCDHVSYNLGSNDYKVYKYVPYGPIHEVLPYLIRRAEENSNILGGVMKERMLLTKEIKRRAFGKE